MPDSLSPELLYERVGKLEEEIEIEERKSDRKRREFESSLVYLGAALFFATILTSLLDGSVLSLVLIIVIGASASTVSFASYFTLSSSSPLVKQRAQEMSARRRLVEVSVQLVEAETRKWIDTWYAERPKSL